MTYRELYFELKKKENKYLNNTAIKTLLQDDGGFNDFFNLINHFDEEVKNLDKINVGDEAIIYYQGKTYNYTFVKIYDVEKAGKAKIDRDNKTSTLTLVTCRHNTNKQIILIAELNS